VATDVDAPVESAAPARPQGRILRLIGQVSRRFGWGLADQAMSSLSNFALSIYVERSLGPAQFGAFSLAYVTYSFVLNASRGLATDPLLVRFSGAELPAWRKAVASSSGTAVLTGTTAGLCMLGAGAALHGTSRAAFVAMGLTMPGLMLQDSWRFAFFAQGRGSRAFFNDTTWTLLMVPALLALRLTGRVNVFWFVLAWGSAATIAASVGPLQSRIMPMPSHAREWVMRHRDLGFRYLAENTTNSGAAQLRTTAVAVIVGLAAVGYVQEALLLMGPFLAVLMGISLVTVPEAAKVLRNSPARLRRFCVLIGGGTALACIAWGVALLVILPHGAGQLILGSKWLHAYPLLLPVTLSVAGTCATVGASAGLRALAASRRSLRAMVMSSVVMVAASALGAYTAGALGTVRGMALASAVAVVLWWWQLHVALRESGIASKQLTLQSRQLTGKPRSRQLGACRQSYEAYLEMLEAGIAREVARTVLPVAGPLRSSRSAGKPPSGQPSGRHRAATASTGTTSSRPRSATQPPSSLWVGDESD